MSTTALTKSMLLLGLSQLHVVDEASTRATAGTFKKLGIATHSATLYASAPLKRLTPTQERRCLTFAGEFSSVA